MDRSHWIASNATGGVLPRRPRAVVFDLDGTLIDSEALVKESYFAAAPSFGIAMTDDHFHAFVGKHMDASQALMREFFGPDFPITDFYAAVSAHIGDRAAPLKPGAIDLFDHLDAHGLLYALCTSSGQGWVDKHFAAHDLHVRFRAVITRDDVENRKPHPEPYLKAAALLGHAPQDVLVLEDSPTGVEAAHAAGLMTVMIPDLLPPSANCRARTLLVASSLHEVLSLLQAHAE